MDGPNAFNQQQQPMDPRMIEEIMRIQEAAQQSYGQNVPGNPMASAPIPPRPQMVREGQMPHACPMCGRP